MAFARLPRSISPFPSESPTPPLSGISVLPPTVASLPDPEEPEPAGNSSLHMSLVWGWHGRVKRVGWFIWDARKGCVPYLFLIIRLAHQLAEKIIPWIHRATNDPPSLSFTLFLLPSTYPTYDALFSSSSNTCNQPRIIFSSGSSTQRVAGEEDDGDQSSARTTPVCAYIN